MHTKATEWVFTSPLDFREAESRRLHEVSFRVLPSPHQMPVAIRAKFEQPAGRRSLELRYIGTEASIKGTYADDAEIEYGRRTLRPTLISVPLSGTAGVGQFVSKVDHALESFMRVHGPQVAHGGQISDLRLNSTIKYIRALIRKYQDQLVVPVDDE